MMVVSRWNSRFQASWGIVGVVGLLAAFSAGGLAQTLPAPVGGFIEAHCLECHAEVEPEAGLDLTALGFDLGNRDVRARWVHIYDRVRTGEMPPDDRGNEVSSADRSSAASFLEAALHRADRRDVLANGRGPLRRLTRSEYENNLRDLLHLPDLDIRDRLPEDRTSMGFSKAAATLDMSRVQLDATLDAAEAALREAMASGLDPVPSSDFRAVGVNLYSKLSEHGGREAMFFARHGRMVPMSNDLFETLRESPGRNQEFELALFRSATWPYYGYPRDFVAPRTGRYQVRFSARAVRQLRNFWLVPATRPLAMTFRARQPSKADVSGDVRATGGIMDILPGSHTYETTVLLKAGETLEYSLLGLPVPHPITSHGGPLYYDFPPMPEEGHRGVVIEWIEMSGPSVPLTWPPPSHRVLFGDLPIGPPRAGSSLAVEVLSDAPVRDARRLLRRFAERAARRPVAASALEPFLALIEDQQASGRSFAEAMLAGYQAFLASGHFLYLPEPRGDAKSHRGQDDDDFAVASRLSHFLWNSRPDAVLESGAKAGRLRDPEWLGRQVDRMIDDDRFFEFVRQFADEWLDLDELRRDLPDIRLYPEYRRDNYLVQSMEAETRATVAALVRENLTVRTLIDADFAYINDRLSRHYGVEPVAGAHVRRVTLPEWSPYGGLMTQGAIMKVTANGTTTSPVVRGAWVMKHLLGDPPPRPPASVPAVEPDIRGAKSIREILARHTKDPSCANCHARFDPVGFALENFDIMGAWRERYRGLEKGDVITGIDRAGHAYEYRMAHAVDAAGRLRTGERFGDVYDLKRILARDPRPLARNLLEQWTLYSTGTPVRFADRREIEAILKRCKPEGYRVRDLLHAFIAGPIFLGYGESAKLTANDALNSD